jgi:hypothetical protein
MVDKNTGQVARLRESEVRVTVRFSPGPAYFHLIEVTQGTQHDCIQIDGSCDREALALVASKVRGLGA